jgi:hypothetical protein
MMWEVTVLHGKTSLAVALPPPASDAKWLETLQRTIAQQTGVAVAHQKLLFRGKQLTLARGAELANGAKLMLLKNARFHQSDAGASKLAAREAEEQSLQEDAPRAVQVAVSQRLGIDARDVDEDHVLVQASRGKSLYEFLFLSTATIASVKTRVGGTLGLPGTALRLLVKGKTPKDDEVLSGFTTTSRVVKCMVLLQAKQHDLVEREEEFRVLQNELTSVEADLQRLAKVLHRNVLAREEALFRLHAVQDHIGRLQSNLGILEDQLKATKLAQGSATLKALENAQQECEALTTRAESLAREFQRGGQ